MPLAGPALDAPVDIRTLLRAGLEREPDAIALVSAEMRWTWRELDDVTNRLAGRLLAMGLRQGDRVASLMPNRTALLIFYIACFKAGLVVVPLNYRYMERQIDYALGLSGTSLLFAHIERQHDWQASDNANKLTHGVLTYGAPAGSGSRYEDLIEGPAKPFEVTPHRDTHPIGLFFTSGSTGLPKAVTHTFGSLGWMFASAAGAFEMTHDDVVLPGSSMSHIGSFMWALAGLALGAKVVVARTFDSHEILPLLRAERPTILCMIPAALMRLVRDHGATKDDFSSIRVCRCGSDKVPAELELEFEQLTGHEIDEGYGMSEVGLASLNPPSGPIKLGSVGRPVPGYAMSIRDDDGNEVPVGTPGRLFMKTGSLMIGYWENPDETKATIQDGWIDSGDIMKADEDGYLWFCGRKKQIIVHDGSNIYPQEVEEAVLEHPSVENAGVIGVHDLLHGEIVRAYISIKEGFDTPKQEEIMAFARDRIGYKAPEQIEYLDQIPLNPTGKIDRVTLKQRAAAHH
ncbi:MAG: class I adenylate-forming enzyme family protein [Pseudomonadota bacterium]